MTKKNVFITMIMSSIFLSSCSANAVRETASSTDATIAPSVNEEITHAVVETTTEVATENVTEATTEEVTTQEETESITETETSEYIYPEYMLENGGDRYYWWQITKDTPNENGVWYQYYEVIELKSTPAIMYSEMNENSDPVTIPAWTPLHAVASDREHWICYESKDKVYRGWLQIDCNYYETFTYANGEEGRLMGLGVKAPNDEMCFMETYFNANMNSDVDLITTPGFGSLSAENSLLESLQEKESKMVVFQGIEEAKNYFTVNSAIVEGKLAEKISQMERMFLGEEKIGFCYFKDSYSDAESAMIYTIKEGDVTKIVCRNQYSADMTKENPSGYFWLGRVSDAEWETYGSMDIVVLSILE